MIVCLYKSFPISASSDDNRILSVLVHAGRQISGCSYFHWRVCLPTTDSSLFLRFLCHIFSDCQSYVLLHGKYSYFAPHSLFYYLLWGSSPERERPTFLHRIGNIYANCINFSYPIPPKIWNGFQFSNFTHRECYYTNSVIHLLQMIAKLSKGLMYYIGQLWLQ